MPFDIIYGRTKTKLNEEIEKKIAEGWERYGEVVITQPKLMSDSIEVPMFVYYSQSVIKED